MKRVAWFSALHGINDCIAGYLLGSLIHLDLANTRIAFYVLFYNILSFLGQVLAAFLIQRMNYSRNLILWSIVFLMGGIFLFEFSTTLSVLLIGVSSAMVHVIGGLESYEIREKASDIGIFASPGVFGLALGGLMAFLRIDAEIALISTLVLLFAGYFIIPKGKEKLQERPKEHSLEFEDHDWIMLLLIGVIALRSVVWNVFQSINEREYFVLLYLAIAAMSGKVLGGFFSDRFGARKYAYFSMLAALPFLTILKENLICSIIGVFLLQSSFPSTTHLLLQKLKTKQSLGIAYSFGISVILGGFIFYSPIKYLLLQNIGITTLLITCSLLLILYPILYKKGLKY